MLPGGLYKYPSIPSSDCEILHNQCFPHSLETQSDLDFSCGRLPVSNYVCDTVMTITKQVPAKTLQIHPPSPPGVCNVFKTDIVLKGQEKEY